MTTVKNTCKTCKHYVPEVKEEVHGECYMIHWEDGDYNPTPPTEERPVVAFVFIGDDQGLEYGITVHESFGCNRYKEK